MVLSPLLVLLIVVVSVSSTCRLFAESVEHTLNELEDMLQSLVRRMIKSELEDFELVSGGTGQNDAAERL